MTRRGPVPQADDRRGESGGLPVDADVAMDALTRAHRDLDRPQNGLPTSDHRRWLCVVVVVVVVVVIQKEGPD